MKLSENGYKILKHYEGLELSAYKDAVGVTTIGYGNTFYENNKPVKMGDAITKQRAEELLKLITPQFEHGVEAAVTVPLTQAKFDALVVLAYNIGLGNFRSSTLLKRLNAGKHIESVVAQFHLWNKGGGKVLKGLVKRRASEAHLFATGEVELF